MVPETAIGIIAGAAGVLGVANGWRNSVILGIGLFMILTVLVGAISPIQLPGHRPTDAMSPSTSVSIAILAVSLVLKRFPSPVVGMVRVSLKSIALAIVGVPLIAYILDSQALLENTFFGAMALHTAICLLLLLIGLLLLDPLLGWVSILLAPEPGSQMARRLMPFIVLGPIILCGLGLVATERDFLSANLRLAVIAYAMIMSTGIATLYFADQINDSERHAAEIEQRLRDSEHDRQQTELAIARSQKVEALGQLVGGVAHDFNNTLTVILGNLELIEGADGEKERQNFVEEAIEATGHAAHLTGQLLAYGRKSRLDAEPQIIDDLIAPSLQMFSRLRPASIEIATKLGAPRAIAAIDSANFQQALLNLLINARDAMSGGGRLTVSTSLDSFGDGPIAGFLETEPLPRGSYVSVAVRDTGTGMTEETLRRATEPFFTTKPVGEGSGLGLSVVSGFCRQSGGGLRIENTSDGGALVTMLFPLTGIYKSDEIKPAPKARSDRLTGAGVLVVDDEPGVTRVISRQLERDGHVVRVALDAQQALAILDAEGPLPDLVLTDLVMPGKMQGHELAAHIRETYPNVQVVLMSGYESESQRRQMPWSTDIPFLQKPIDRGTLRAIVAEALAARPDQA